jgi:tetratricopeptide (TPR) repeat protein
VTTLLLVCTIPVAHADQYRSEVKELETPPPQQQVDEQKLLQITTDPYAKALLLRDLAVQAAGSKDYAKAAKYMEQAVAQGSLSGPAQEEMKRLLGQLYMASGDPQKIIEGLGGRGKSGSLSPDEMAALGSAFVKLKRYSEGIPFLKRSLSQSKLPNPSGMLSLLSAYMATGQQKEALPIAEQLVRVAPQVREAWLNLAALQLKFGTRERAQAVMELAQRQGYLQSADERLQLINLTAQIGAPFEAGSLLQSWLEDAALPKNTDNWKFLGATWIAARERGLAVAALREAYKLSPSSETLLQIGQLELDRERYAEAQQALEKAVSAGAGGGGALMGLGLAQYQQANIDGALKTFRKASEYAGSRAQAEQWMNYLETPAATEVAQIAAGQRRPRPEIQAQLSKRLLGKSLPITEAPPTDLSTISMSTAQLTGEFTPIGAERAASAAGSIPAWTGGLAKGQWPASFKPGGRLADPFPTDKPLFVITPQNSKQYADKLSAGHRALLAKYSDYKMPVFQTRRSVAYPQAIYDATQANIGKAKLIGSDALQGARLGFPFPRPQNGVEVMWNHRTRYRGDTVESQSSQAVVTPGGVRQRLKQVERVLYRYSNVKNPQDLSKRNVLLYYLTWFSQGGGKSIDFLVLVHETLNSIKEPRNIWVLPPGIRRMFRIPPVGYDQPFPGSEAIYLIDMVDMYNGAFDRYVWKLTGKRELYLPYNSFRLSDGRYKYAQLLTPNHFNQEPTRYELHRVWIIEATERGGKKHLFGKRVFYVDEDTWNVVLVENQDHDGKLWRFQEGHLLPFYDAQFANCLPVVTYDFKNGNYFVNRLTGEDPAPQYGMQMSEQEFLPDPVKARYAH